MQQVVGVAVMLVLIIGLYMWDRAKSRRIKGTVTNGAACRRHANCASDYCDVDTKQCRAKKVNGEACRRGFECVSNNCDERNLVCR